MDKKKVDMRAGGCVLRKGSAAFEQHVRRIVEKVMSLANARKTKPTTRVQPMGSKEMRVAYPRPMEHRHVKRVFDGFNEYAVQLMPANFLRHQGYLLCLEYSGTKQACLIDKSGCWLLVPDKPMPAAFRGTLLACVWTADEVRIYDALVVAGKVVTRGSLIRRLAEAATLFPARQDKRIEAKAGKQKPNICVVQPMSLFHTGEWIEEAELETLDACELWIVPVEPSFYELARVGARYVGQHVHIVARCQPNPVQGTKLDLCVPRTSHTAPPPPPTPLPVISKDLQVLGTFSLTDERGEEQEVAAAELARIRWHDERVPPWDPKDRLTPTVRLRLIPNSKEEHQVWVPDASLPDPHYPGTALHKLMDASKFFHFRDLRHVISSVRQGAGVPHERRRPARVINPLP